MTNEALREAIERLVHRRSRQTGRVVESILGDADVLALRAQQKVRRLSYVGKPNRYRAQEAQRFLQRRAHEHIVHALEVEFDRNGLIFSSVKGEVW
jgi:hypothetical protein